jgi:hypothetical protein
MAHHRSAQCAFLFHSLLFAFLDFLNIQLKILGWAGYLKVDSTTYRWLGNNPELNNVTVNTLPISNLVNTIVNYSCELEADICPRS